MDPILPEPRLTSDPAQNHASSLQPENTGPQQNNGGGQPNPINPGVTPQPPTTQPLQQTQPVQNQQQVVSQSDSSSTQLATPLIADDVDVIEKEWVDKAKQIVDRTKEDPYLQEKEVSKLQADYLAKRYNKKIKRTD